MIDYLTTIPSAARAAVMSQGFDLGIVTSVYLTSLEDEDEEMMPENFDHRQWIIHFEADKNDRMSIKPKKNRVKVLPNLRCDQCGVLAGLNSRSGANFRCIGDDLKFKACETVANGLT